VRECGILTERQRERNDGKQTEREISSEWEAERMRDDDRETRRSKRWKIKRDTKNNNKIRRDAGRLTFDRSYERKE